MSGAADRIAAQVARLSRAAPSGGQLMGAAALIVLGGAVIWYLTRPGQAGKAGAGVGQAAGTFAATAAIGTVEGIVFSLGDAVGLPRTDTDKCRRALDEGRMWDASFDCPAGDFLGGAWRRMTGG